MFPGQRLRTGHTSNNTSGSVWEEFNMFWCDDFKGSQIAWAVCSVLCFAFGVPACVAILWDMFEVRSRGTPFTPNSFLILNLSVMDVVFLSFLPVGVFNDFIWKCWIVHEIWGGIFALNLCGRPFLTACICLDCYLAVVHPIIYHRTKHLAPRVAMVAVVWMLTVAFGTGFVLSSWLQIRFFVCLPFVIAMVIIGVCDSFIFHRLYKSDPGRKTIHPQKQRAVQTIINSLVVSLLSYLPPVILITCGRSLASDSKTFVCNIAIPSNISASLGSALMPLLHLHNSGKLDCFKLGGAGILHSLKIRCCKG